MLNPKKYITLPCGDGECIETTINKKFISAICIDIPENDEVIRLSRAIVHYSNGVNTVITASLNRGQFKIEYSKLFDSLDEFMKIRDKDNKIWFINTDYLVELTSTIDTLCDVITIDAGRRNYFLIHRLDNNEVTKEYFLKNY